MLLSAVGGNSKGKNLHSVVLQAQLELSSLLRALIRPVLTTRMLHGAHSIRFLWRVPSYSNPSPPWPRLRWMSL